MAAQFSTVLSIIPPPSETNFIHNRLIRSWKMAIYRQWIKRYSFSVY